MNVNNTLSSYTYNPSTPKTTAQQIQSQERFSIEPSSDTKNTSDKVSLSVAGVEMSDLMDPPLPVGAIPSWLGEFATKVTFPSERAAQGRAGSLELDPRFSNLSSAEADEYFSLLQSHTNALYERNGLIDDESTYAAFNSRSTNERLHQEFLEGIRNDPRMSELTGRLGIALS
ncbi:hypothetical protein [Pseudomonas vanderleydeniana]|uniref:Uncharacterized protein n=1 Tax=Pseudomonas vanderleydeniana TaxID=2745495 RepID=A0A9E6PI24_9PSED|nr:hypothetical protein [Pseudomonas vanderleydeniana]QXI26461.1 hypothetical protein HU752_021305 [Pseudomonas vanderleydeniana]